MPPKPPSQKLTHFLCIPLITPSSLPSLSTSLSHFHRTVSAPSHVPSIPASAVRPLRTLHLTLGVMSLGTEERVEEALGVLRGLDLGGMVLEALSPESEASSAEKIGTGTEGKGKGREKGKESNGIKDLRITLRGLKSMQAPTSTSTLYAPPLHSSALSSFCLALKRIFTDAGLLVPDDRGLLLHVTVVNTVYVPRGRGQGRGQSQGGGVRDGGGSGGAGQRRKGRITIDAQEMLEDWAEFTWMEGVKVERVAVCRMGAKKGADGEEAYVVEGSVDMP